MQIHTHTRANKLWSVRFHSPLYFFCTVRALNASTTTADDDKTRTHTSAACRSGVNYVSYKVANEFDARRFLCGRCLVHRWAIHAVPCFRLNHSSRWCVKSVCTFSTVASMRRWVCLWLVLLGCYLPCYLRICVGNVLLVVARRFTPGGAFAVSHSANFIREIAFARRCLRLLLLLLLLMLLLLLFFVRVDSRIFGRGLVRYSHTQAKYTKS